MSRITKEVLNGYEDDAKRFGQIDMVRVRADHLLELLSAAKRVSVLEEECRAWRDWCAEETGGSGYPSPSIASAASAVGELPAGKAPRGEGKEGR